MGTDRDYYADLELPPTADITEIKKQFRKLALKYHPDRNPGREAEVNAQFQVIQSAHEVLGDPQQKAKYDASFSRSRFPGASGVKGNPWANAGDQFPPPPRRNPAANPRRTAAPQPPPSGADRWHTRFTSGTAPTAKQHMNNNPELKKNAAKAFEHMRKNAGGPSASNAQKPQAANQAPPPPPMPPRNESARQRREASFGARKAGRTGGIEDEGPATRQSYNTGPPPPMPPREPATPQKSQTPLADPLRQFREPASPYDPRQSTPYSRHGGEKTNPFDGTNLSRTKSARESASAAQSEQSSSDDRAAGKHRSSSVPKHTGAGSHGEDLRTDPSTGRPHSSTQTTANHDQSSFRAGVDNDASDQKPSMYDSSRNHNPTTRGAFYMYRNTDSIITPNYTRKRSTTTGPNGLSPQASAAPSGAHSKSPSHTMFEISQGRLLHQLIKNAEYLLRQGCRNDGKPIPQNSPSKTKDLTCVSSFTIPVDDDTFRQTSPEPKPFTRSSTEDITTDFVEENGSQWRFSAGGERPIAQPKSRKQPSAAASPTKSSPSAGGDVPPQPHDAQTEAAFNATGWNAQFGPETFVPKRDQTSSASPSRTNRKNSRKARNSKATAGSAAIIEDSSDDEASFQWQGRKMQPDGGVESPLAMDIDSPPAKSANTTPPEHSARSIPLQPSRTDWREGTTPPVTDEPRPSIPTVHVQSQPQQPAGGSEDTEEFRATFADLRNVAPFANDAGGLKSFADLKDNLPFESKPSSGLLSSTLPPLRPLQFPAPPSAPRPPPTAAIAGMQPTASSWSKYLEEFEQYLRQWDQWNGTVTDHFRERKRQTAQAREETGYGFLGVRGDGDITKYYEWILQDNDVRKRWTVACEEHERRFVEFISFREKMK